MLGLLEAYGSDESESESEKFVYFKLRNSAYFLNSQGGF